MIQRYPNVLAPRWGSFVESASLPLDICTQTRMSSHLKNGIRELPLRFGEDNSTPRREIYLTDKFMHQERMDNEHCARKFSSTQEPFRVA